MLFAHLKRILKLDRWLGAFLPPRVARSEALRDVPQREFLYLARGGHRELVEGLQALGPIRACDPFGLEELLHFLEGQPFLFSKDDERAATLPQPLVGHRHDRDLADGRMTVKNVLDFYDRDVLA